MRTARTAVWIFEVQVNMGWQLNSNISRERVRILIDEARKKIKPFNLGHLEDVNKPLLPFNKTDGQANGNLPDVKLLTGVQTYSVKVGSK